MPELQVLNGPYQWKTIRVQGPRFLIGRKEGCHLVLKDGWISREHSVLIETSPGEFTVQDLDSENGIYVNGARVTEAQLKHSDILRIGRTEMRFFNPGPGEEEQRRESTVRDRVMTGAATRHEGEVVDEAASLDMTVHEPGHRRADRTDFRERVRRLEKLLQAKEEDNARLGAENAVLKRAMASAGLLDRQTGQVDLGRLLTPPAREVIPPWVRAAVLNPLARMSFPKPDGGIVEVGSSEDEPDLAQGIFRVGVIGAGAGGARLADAFFRAGHRHAVAFSTKEQALSELSLPTGQRIVVDLPEGATGVTGGARAVRDAQIPLVSALRHGLGTDRDLYLITSDLTGPAAAGGIGPLADFLRDYDALVQAADAPPLPVAAVVAVPEPSELEDEETLVLARNGIEAARTLLEAGKVHPLFLFERQRLARFFRGPSEEVSALADATMAGAVDTLFRLPLMPSLSGAAEAEAVRKMVLGGGLSTMGLAATDAEAAADAGRLRDVLAYALGGGLLLGSVPASRAQAACVMMVIGSEVLAGRSQWLNRLETAVEEARGFLPQARLLTAIYEDRGTGIRIFTWLGGLPFPERLVG